MSSASSKLPNIHSKRNDAIVNLHVETNAGSLSGRSVKHFGPGRWATDLASLSRSSSIVGAMVENARAASAGSSLHNSPLTSETPSGTNSPTTSSSSSGTPPKFMSGSNSASNSPPMTSFVPKPKEARSPRSPTESAHLPPLKPSRPITLAPLLPSSTLPETSKAQVKTTSIASRVVSHSKPAFYEEPLVASPSKKQPTVTIRSATPPERMAQADSPEPSDEQILSDIFNKCVSGNTYYNNPKQLLKLLVKSIGKIERHRHRFAMHPKTLLALAAKYTLYYDKDVGLFFKEQNSVQSRISALDLLTKYPQLCQSIEERMVIVKKHHHAHSESQQKESHVAKGNSESQKKTNAADANDRFHTEACPLIESITDHIKPYEMTLDAMNNAIADNVVYMELMGEFYSTESFPSDSNSTYVDLIEQKKFKEAHDLLEKSGWLERYVKEYSAKLEQWNAQALKEYNEAHPDEQLQSPLNKPNPKFMLSYLGEVMRNGKLEDIFARFACYFYLQEKRPDLCVGANLVGPEGHPISLLNQPTIIQMLRYLVVEKYQRKANLAMHAGELNETHASIGVRSSVVRQAIYAGSKRIGHMPNFFNGTDADAIETAKLMRDQGISAEMCLSGNALMVESDLSSHSFNIFREMQVKVGIELDDPAMFGIESLTSEYIKYHEDFQLSMADIIGMEREKATTIFAPEATRTEVAKALDKRIQVACMSFKHIAKLYATPKVTRTLKMERPALSVAEVVSSTYSTSKPNSDSNDHQPKIQDKKAAKPTVVAATASKGSALPHTASATPPTRPTLPKNTMISPLPLARSLSNPGGPKK